MELIQREIEVGADSVKIAWTIRWLLSPTAIEALLADPKKKTTSVKITMMNHKDKDKIIEKGIRFGRNRHRADGFMRISPDILVLVCCHW